MYLIQLPVVWLKRNKNELQSRNEVFGKSKHETLKLFYYTTKMSRKTLQSIKHVLDFHKMIPYLKCGGIEFPRILWGED